MAIKSVFDKLLDLISQSQGDFIQLKNGESYCFHQQKIHSLAEIQLFENSYAVKLSKDYQNFLQILVLRNRIQRTD